MTGARRRPAAERWDVLLAIAAGGAAGATARYGLYLAFPHRAGDIPVGTLTANVAGCLLIGALMAAIVEATSPHRLLRPFVGIGLLGGFTTFSTYILDVFDVASDIDLAVALAYAAGTVFAALTAVFVGLVLTRAIIGPRGA